MLVKRMTLLSLLTAVSLAAASANAAQPTVKGVNYDPVHSIDFATAVGTDDRDGMIDAIELDLDKLKELHDAGYPDIKVLKTFFSSFGSLGMNKPRVEVPIADVVANWNAKNPKHAVQLALGVYEFQAGKDACQDEDCKRWTASQVKQACASANAHPGLIRKIVVGNENIGGDSPASRVIADRMASDIMSIRACLSDQNIRVGTAQTAEGGRELVEGVYPALKEAVQFIGVNVYPFWSGTNYSSAKAEMETYWERYPRVAMETVETEEGWPSGGGNNGNAESSPDSSVDYFNYWYTRTGSSVPAESYYFALFDKTPGQGVESNWGLFSADRHSGILGDLSSRRKPLAPENKMVKFNNGLADKTISISACKGDWDGQSQSECFPIDGYFGTGEIQGHATRAMMVETSGKNYASLLLTYHSAGGKSLRLCYIDQAALRTLQDDSWVSLYWHNSQGNVACGVQ